MSKDELVEIDGEIEAKTEQAILFHTGNKSEAVWLPRSRIQVEKSGFEGIFTVTLPEWMAIDRGLI